MPRFVLEIGTEEIPPRFFPPALAQLRRDGRQMLERARLGFEDVKVYGAPRRLALVVDGLADRQASETREERGPAAKVAFDSDGNPTKAAQGFARRYGLSPEQLVKKETDQGEYVFAVVASPELSAAEALAGLLPDLIAGLSFPKTMRWGTGKLRFGRPIRWLLALVGEDVVSFELGGLRSNRETRGHPVLADGMAPVESAADYERALYERFVLVDPEKRRSAIGQQLETIATAESARIVDGGLLEETAFLAEWPTAACGRFDDDFLRLPRPVLIDEMQHVQSYFPLENEKGELLPKFIAVRDGGADHLDLVLTGWENVLRAKLIDAGFFYEQDLKRIGDRGTPQFYFRRSPIQGLFVEHMGLERAILMMYDHPEVIQRHVEARAVAAAAAGQVGLSADDTKTLDRAALLCKADLTTEVVVELSALQGIMGGVYAETGGEKPAVARAIAQHYRPRSADDAIPETKLGRLLALADKIDTLAALFAVGIVPTGSADPFGLRREAAGVVAIALGTEGRLSVGALIETALNNLSSEVEVKRSRQEVAAQVIEFLRQRVETQLREDQGIRYDLVDAALAPGIDDIFAAAERARTLNELKDSPDFLPTVIACTRPMNISKDFEGGRVDPKLFQDPSENALWEAYQKVASQADDVPLSKLFELIAKELRAPIDTYFDDVLVMAEDDKLRRNRLAMCWQLSQLFRRIADFSLIVQA